MAAASRSSAPADSASSVGLSADAPSLSRLRAPDRASVGVDADVRADVVPDCP
jgi:hypothetical protein